MTETTKQATHKTSEQVESDVAMDILTSDATPSTMGLLHRYIALRATVEETEEAHETAVNHCDAVERELVNRMLEEGIRNVKTSDGRTAYLAHQLYCNVLAENREALHKYLRDTGRGELIKSTETVHSSTLKSMVKEMVGEELDFDRLPDELKSIINASDGFEVRILSAKK